MYGLHIIAEWHACDGACAPMHEAGALRALCLAACEEVGLETVAEAFHGFGSTGAPAGATGAVVLAESHLAIHTWPELAAVTLDLYVCNFSRDNRAAAEAAYRRLLAAFQPRHVMRRDLERGTP